MATLPTVPTQNLVPSALLGTIAHHPLRLLAVQDFTVKMEQHPVVFVQVALSVLGVEQPTPCVWKASMLAMVLHPAHHVMLVTTVLSMALLNQSSVQVATILL